MAYTAEKAFNLIENAYRRGRLAHAFLITGASGSGKKELAAKIISLVNPPADVGGANLFGEVEEPALKSLDELEGEFVRLVRPRSKSRRIIVSDMRELEKSFHVAAAPGKWKVGVILYADRMGAGAENAFLKTLEEPPADCLLLLLSDAPELLLPTVLSRCVKLPLMTSSQDRVFTDEEQELLASLALLSRQGMGKTASALTLCASFREILARKKLEISKLNDLAFKEETKKYKNSTDSDAWLKEREKFFLAHTEAEYLNVRDKLLAVMISWMGDVIRQKCGVTELDLASEKTTTQQVGESFEMGELLTRMSAMEELRAHLETNVQEQLALEVTFMEAFG